METIEAILTRRSVREFAPGDISEAQLETLLQAAMAAPSAYNRQPWHFVVIQNKEVLNNIKNLDPDAPMAGTATACIVVCGDTWQEEVVEFTHVNCAAATQNILLAAHALGLGAVWCGITPGIERIRTYCEVLELPKHILPVSAVYIGRPAETIEAVDRFLPSRIHLEHW